MSRNGAEKASRHLLRAAARDARRRRARHLQRERPAIHRHRDGRNGGVRGGLCRCWASACGGWRGGCGIRGGPLTRLGIAALDRPGSATVRLSVALGLGLSLLVMLAGVGSSLLGELQSNIPRQRPGPVPGRYSGGRGSSLPRASSAARRRAPSFGWCRRCAVRWWRSTARGWSTCRRSPKAPGCCAATAG